MAEITAGMVKELRERTGLGMMDCKKALVEAEGNLEQAIEDLRKASGLKAAKKAGRTAAEGIVMAKVADDNSYAAMIEVNSETDFVARDDNFLSFVGNILDTAFAQKESSVEAILAGGVETAREALVQKVGENISLRRIQLLETAEGAVGSYVHNNNRIAVLVQLKGGDAVLARDIAMHIAASNPLVVRSEELSQDLLEKEREIYTAQAAESGKPADIVAKMVEGRVRKYVAEVTLLDQQFVKDPELTIAALVKKAGADVVSFVRYEVGEGIEKEVVDFAEEVKAQAAAAKQ